MTGVVAITGANGRLGREVVPRLLDRGDRVRALVRRRVASADPRVDWRELDMTDELAVTEALDSVTGVIHAAAIPGPGKHPDGELFFNNVGATFSVVRAVETRAIKRIVLAGSVSALGGAWARDRFPPDYAPVDEAHSLRPEDVYGLTKLIDEELGQWLARRWPPASVTLLRFHWILTAAEVREAAADVAKDPRHMAHLLWGYVDVRDAAEACIRSLDRPTPGFATAIISAADTLSPEPTESLIRLYAPTTQIRAPIPDCSSAWSLVAARRLFKYSPRYSWRMELG